MDVLQGGVVSTSPNPLSWRTTPCRLTTTAYSIYSQLPSSIACPSSASRTQRLGCVVETGVFKFSGYGKGFRCIWTCISSWIMHFGALCKICLVFRSVHSLTCIILSCYFKWGFTILTNRCTNEN